MSDAEAVMWAVEKDPELRSDFCNLTILDQAVDPQRLRAKIEHAIAVIPRLGQRVVNPVLRIANPQWVDDPTLDLDYHLRTVALPAPGTHAQLLALCAQLAEAPFDRARPLWEFTVIEGLEGGRSAMLQKMHHTITDGVGAMRLSMEIVDIERDAVPPAVTEREAETDGGPLRVTGRAIADAVARPFGVAKGAVNTTAKVVTDPLHLPQRIGDAWKLAGSVRRQVVVTERAHSDVIDDRTVARCFLTLTVPLPAVHDAAHALGGSINDVFVTAVTGALGRYHEACGSTVTELRMAMPVSTRTKGDHAANRFVPSRVLVPIQPVDDPRARFAETRARLAATKQEQALAAAEGLAGLVSGLPTALLVSLTRGQVRTIDFATSNVRGAPFPLYLAGARIEAAYPFGPRTGCALNVTMMSLCDELHLGLNIDPHAIGDPELFVAMLAASFDELVACATGA